MELPQNQPMPTFNVQSQPERQNTNPYFRFRQHLQTNSNIKLGEKNNEQSLDFSEKILYNGNLRPLVTFKDLHELFGFKTTGCLQKTCKLNGVAFKSNPIKIEDAKVKPKTRSQQEISIIVISIFCLNFPSSKCS